MRRKNTLKGAFVSTASNVPAIITQGTTQRNGQQLVNLIPSNEKPQYNQRNTNQETIRSVVGQITNNENSQSNLINGNQGVYMVDGKQYKNGQQLVNLIPSNEKPQYNQRNANQGVQIRNGIAYRNGEQLVNLIPENRTLRRNDDEYVLNSLAGKRTKPKTKKSPLSYLENSVRKMF